MQGRLIAALTPSSIKRAGCSAQYEYVWNGAGYASGAYLVSANVQGKTWKKAVILKMCRLQLAELEIYNTDTTSAIEMFQPSLINFGLTSIPNPFSVCHTCKIQCSKVNGW